MFSKQNRDKLQKIIKKYNFCQQSPYSESFYTEGKTHCKLDNTSEYLQKWLVCEYHNGTYHIVEEVFTAEEEAREARLSERHRNLVDAYFQAKEGTKKFKKLQSRMFKPCKYSIEL